MVRITEYISLQEMKQGQCICPLSWSVHCNFNGDGKCNERGWACTPHPHQARLILPSWLNVRQKADVTTLCTLWLEYYVGIVQCTVCTHTYCTVVRIGPQYFDANLRTILIDLIELHNCIYLCTFIDIKTYSSSSGFFFKLGFSLIFWRESWWQHVPACHSC
jgi:hypothetical protein